MKNTGITQLLTDENTHLEKLQRIVSEAIDAEKLIVKNLLHPPHETLSVGQKVSDKVARFGDSWKFIIFFGIVLFVWIVFNVVAIKAWRFDPFPFILMNLVLSCIAAMQAPIIMIDRTKMTTSSI